MLSRVLAMSLVFAVLVGCGGGGGGGGGGGPTSASPTAYARFADVDASSVTMEVGRQMVLHGSDSTDPEDDALTYSWNFDSQPAGSVATLTDADTAAPFFRPDKAGDYVAALVVNDGTSDSDPVTVTITAEDWLHGGSSVAGLGNAMGAVGDTVSVPVYMSNVTGVNMSGGHVSYDPARLSYVGCTAGEIAGLDAASCGAPTPGDLSFTQSPSGFFGEFDIGTDKVLITLQFQILAAGKSMLTYVAPLTSSEMGVELAVNYDMYGMVVSNGTGLSVAPTATAAASAFTTVTYDLNSALTIDDSDGEATASFVEWDLTADIGGDSDPTNDYTEISLGHSGPRSPGPGFYSVKYLVTDGDFEVEATGDVVVLPDDLAGRPIVQEVWETAEDSNFYPTANMFAWSDITSFNIDMGANSLTDTTFQSELVDFVADISPDHGFWPIFLINEDQTLWLWQVTDVNTYWTGLPAGNGMMVGIQLTPTDYTELYNIYMGF